jgi:hypothetical protein
MVGLVLYVLSIGPVIYVDTKFKLGLQDGPYFWRVYGPVGWLYTDTPLRRPLAYYEDWWFFLAKRDEIDREPK